MSHCTIVGLLRNRTSIQYRLVLIVPKSPTGSTHLTAARRLVIAHWAQLPQAHHTTFTTTAIKWNPQRIGFVYQSDRPLYTPDTCPNLSSCRGSQLYIPSWLAGRTQSGNQIVVPCAKQAPKEMWATCAIQTFKLMTIEALLAKCACTHHCTSCVHFLKVSAFIGTFSLIW